MVLMTSTTNQNLQKSTGNCYKDLTVALHCIVFLCKIFEVVCYIDIVMFTAEINTVDTLTCLVNEGLSSITFNYVKDSYLQYLQLFLV